MGVCLSELRTPELLVECVTRFSEMAHTTAARRAAVAAVRVGDPAAIARALAEEEAEERAADRAYWAPLRLTPPRRPTSRPAPR